MKNTRAKTFLKPHTNETRWHRLVRPNWATFAMEEAFWENLRQICTSHELAPGDYIAKAKEYIEIAGRQFPNMRVDQAVRLRIVQDLRDQATCLLGKQVDTSENTLRMFITTQRSNLSCKASH